MAYFEIGNGIWIGKKADTRPTSIPTDTVIYERDTGTFYHWNGSRWVIKGSVFPSVKNVGIDPCISLTSNIGSGLTSLMTSATAPTHATLDADGKGIAFATTAVQDTLSGKRAGTVCTWRQFNPRMNVRFKLSATNDVRLWIGFRNTAAPTGDTALNSMNGVAFGIYAANNTTGAGSTVGWQFAHNGNTATATTVNTGTAANTSTHTVEIIGDDAGARWGFSLDGAAYTYATSNIPGQQSNLCPFVQIQNSTANDKVLTLYGIEIEQDK